MPSLRHWMMKPLVSVVFPAVSHPSGLMATTRCSSEIGIILSSAAHVEASSHCHFSFAVIPAPSHRGCCILNDWFSHFLSAADTAMAKWPPCFSAKSWAACQVTAYLTCKKWLPLCSSVPSGNSSLAPLASFSLNLASALYAFSFFGVGVIIGVGVGASITGFLTGF